MVVERKEENTLTQLTIWRYKMRIDMVPRTDALDLTAYTSPEAVLHVSI